MGLLLYLNTLDNPVFPSITMWGIYPHLTLDPNIIFN
jgi:hypothetical protein